MSVINQSIVYVSWSNGAPALAGTTQNHNMAAVGNPAAGQIQINFTTGTPGVVRVTGNAGPGHWTVIPLNNTGLIKVVDAAGAAVAFGSTTGFVFLTVQADMA